MEAIKAVLTYERIVKKWTRLRRFAGCTIDAALASTKKGHTEVASYFTKLIYLLPFSPKSLEKVLLYSLVKASHGFVKKETSYYEISTYEIPGFDPDEKDKIRSAYESMQDLNLADIISPDKIRLKIEVVNELVKPIASYVAAKIEFRDLNPEAFSYPYNVISGISSLYVMQKEGRLPRSYTVMTGLLAPLCRVLNNGKIDKKSTITAEEWEEARQRMSKIKLLKNIFDVEYFHAIGVLYGNKIITRSYPLEVSGTFVEHVIAPAYERYYTLTRERIISRNKT